MTKVTPSVKVPAFSQTDFWQFCRKNASIEITLLYITKNNTDNKNICNLSTYLTLPWDKKCY